VTDNTAWQSPAGGPPPPGPPPAPPASPPQAPDGYVSVGPPMPPPPPPAQNPWAGQGPGQWQGQQWQGQTPGQQWQGQLPGQGAGWTPPPKPGLIPLRPLGFGTLLGASFQVIRRNPRPTLGISLLLNGGITVFFVAVFGGVAALVFGRANSATSDNADEILAGSIGALVLASLIPLALSVVVTAILQGVISLEVSRGTIGEKLTVRGLWRLARGRIGALIGWSALVSGVTVVAIVVLSLLIVLIVSIGGDLGVGLAVVFGIFAGLAAVAIAFWLTTKLALVPSILMLERLPLFRAVSRSWALTRGYFWKTLGTSLLVNVIVQTAAQVVTVPVSLVFTFGGLLINPNGDEAAAVGALIVGNVVTGIVGLVFGAIATVTTSAVYALIYIDIRMRKEALDLDLTRFVEARQVGEAGVGNPYLPADVGFAGKAGFTAAAMTNASPWM